MRKFNTMALSSLISLALSHLLIFHLAQGETNFHSNCTENFDCGSLGVMSFPFSKHTEPSCGLAMVDCDAKPPRVRLSSEGNWYETIGKQQLNTIRINIPWLQQKTCFRFNTLFLPHTALISFTIFPNITLFKCDNSDHQTNLHDSFAGYVNFTSCEAQGYHIYYKYPGDRDHPSALVTPPSCSMFQLPMVPFNPNLDPNDLFNISASEVNLEWHLSADCYRCHHRGGQCQLDSDNRFQCARGYVEGSHLQLILGIVISASGVGILIITLFWLERRYSIFNFKIDEYQNVETFLRNYGSLAPKRYRFYNVKRMTNSFKIKLGEGGYGSVYRGKLRDGSLVAVKILNESKGNGEEFINEVASISMTSHVNIVKLVGFCFERNKRALIYEYMHNGSLEKFIYDKPSLQDRKLGWQTLYKIAVGIARGLEYLHRGCNTQILHFDIKPHNILLDEDFGPKISDFGLSKLCTRRVSDVSIFGARGTIGYIAPEVICRTFGVVSHKSDVYSYGMMILEMVGGRKSLGTSTNHTSETYCPHWIYKQLELNNKLELEKILDEEDSVKARKMIIVSLWCIQTDPSTRPSMTNVVEMLEGSLVSLQIPPKPYLFSPPRSTVESYSI